MTTKQTTTSNEQINEVLSRVNLDLSLEELVGSTVEQFALGKASKFELIRHGYQDLNIKVSTDSGEFILKVFSKRRTLTNVEEQTRTLNFFYENGVPVPHLVPCCGNPISMGEIELFGVVPSSKGDAYVAVLEFFKGPSFDDIKPKETDYIYLAGCLARMHRLSYRISQYYDDWGAANLVNEFEEKGKLLEAENPISKKELLTTEDRKTIEKIVDRMKKVNLNKFRQCVIHGDLYRSHVLKKNELNYCIIDFGCMDFNAAILDLAIFAAHFCMDGTESPREFKRIIELVEHAYRAAGGTITHAEKEVMPLLMGASYATYVIATTNLIAAKGDTSKATQGWLDLARRKLQAFVEADVVPLA